MNGKRAVDHRDVEWDRVAHAAYVIQQTYRYEYPGSISALDHRLVVVPPDRFGDQRRVVHRVTASQQGELGTSEDGFGNTVVELRFPRVDRTIEFRAWVAVERSAPVQPHLVPATWLTDPRLLEPSVLTEPDARLVQVAEQLRSQAGGGRGSRNGGSRNGGTNGNGAAHGPDDLHLAALVNEWVFRTMRYEAGVTGVATTAAQALALGRGVCQDYAHVMIAICRLLGLPARYVSGHMLGEGATHAWVEVLAPHADAPGLAAAWPFDPTHGRAAGLDYVTVAVGRDYRDVAPTSGGYLGGPAGRLTSRKRVEVARVEYLSA